MELLASSILATMSSLDTIWFYLPPGSLPGPINEAQSVELTLQDLGTGWQTATAWAWILQTYLRLRPRCDLVKLTHQIPERGILVAFRGSIPFHYKPSRNVLFVCICADAGDHPFAHIQVVQNPTQTRLIKNSYHIPHWPQFNIMPRNPLRGDTFVNVDYFGDPPNLQRELKSPEWESFLRNMKCNWRIRPCEEWNDYRDTDAVVAIRSFDGNQHHHKPASKLMNAMHAGVPAILGDESAYAALRQTPLDYIAAKSLADVKEAVMALKNDVALCRKMRENAKIRSSEFSHSMLVNQWEKFLDEEALPAYRRVLKQNYISRTGFIVGRYSALRWRGIKARINWQ
jgi:hypothetical protein